MRAVIVVDIPDHMYNEDDPLDVIAGEARAHIDLGDVTIDDVILHRDQRFIDTLMECIKISSSKGNDYSPGEDP